MPRRTVVAGLLSAGLLVGALGASPVAAASSAVARAAHVSPTAASTATFPVTVATAYGPLRIPSKPRRIISLSPTATEMLYAIDARPQVVAVDDDSDYPKHIPRTSLSGYTPNVEAIAGYHPDLVVISYNPTPPNLVSSLHLLNIPVLYLPAASNLAQTYTEIGKLGKVTGESVHANKLVASMRTKIASLKAHVAHRATPLTYFYELDPTLYSATSDTFIGSVLTLAGLHDITGASVHGSDYPQLSAEAVVHANPTFIFLADGASVSSVAARPGWSSLSAVREHRVIELNEDIASRWGPRIVDLLAQVVAAVNKVPVSKGA